MAELTIVLQDAELKAAVIAWLEKQGRDAKPEDVTVPPGVTITVKTRPGYNGPG